MKTIKQVAVVYKMAILMGVLFSINALSTAIVASFMNTEWSSLTPTGKFIIVWVVLQNWTGTLIAFFNKTITRIEAGQFPIDTDSTPDAPRTIVKTVTQQQTTSVDITPQSTETKPNETNEKVNNPNP